MLSSGAVTAIVSTQLALAFIAVILAAFSAACFGAEFGYVVVWWSFGWTLVMNCLRWYSRDFDRSVREQMIHFGFEVFALVNWLVALAVLVALDVRLNRLKRDYDYARQNHLALSEELQTHLFNTLGLAGLYVTYVLNVFTGIIALLLVISAYSSISLMRATRKWPGVHNNEYVADNNWSQERFTDKPVDVGRTNLLTRKQPTS